MRNLWQEEREVLNHTYINHYFSHLISRPKFKELSIAKRFDSKEIQEVITNFSDIENRVQHLLKWANPYAIDSTKISELSHLHGIDLEDSSMTEYFNDRENHYKILYQDTLVPKIENTTMALANVAYDIDKFKKESDSIDEKFIDNFRNNVYILSESLRAFKEIKHNYEN